MPPQPIYADENQFIYDFRSRFVQLGSYTRFSGTWSPVIDYYERPSNISFDVAHRAILFQPFCETNPGHFMDLLHTVYSLPFILGFKHSTNIRVLDLVNSSPAAKHRKELLSCISSHEPIFLSKSGNICFRNLFVGASSLSTLEATELSSRTAEDMKELLVSNILTENKVNTPIQHKIIILQKNKKPFHVFENGTSEGSTNDFNHVINNDEMVNFINATFYDFAEVITIIPDYYSWKELIQIVQSATILITPPGGGSFAGTFLKKGSGLIVLDKNFGHHSMRDVATVGSDDNWWTHLHYVHLFHYPVCKRAECPGNIVVKLPRMFYVIILAMLRVERGEYAQNIPYKMRITSLFHNNRDLNPQPPIQICSIFENMTLPLLNIQNTIINKEYLN